MAENDTPRSPSSDDSSTGDSPWWQRPTGSSVDSPGPGAQPAYGSTQTLAPPEPIPAPATPAPAQRHAPRAWRRTATGTLALALVAGGSGAGGAWWATDHAASSGGVVTAAAPAAAGSTTATAATESLAKVAAAAQPSVVSITVTTTSGGDTGSGVVLRSDGTIVTNNHVVADAASGGGTIEVKFSDGRKAAATIVGRDPSVDLAVIRAEGVSGLSPATLGSTSSVHVGDTVLALGSPLGLDGSVSAGIVSALHRTVSVAGEQQQQQGNGLFGQQQQSTTASGSAVGDAIQTDAAVNPGNSGGPLVDSSGRVIGITTAIATLGSSGTSQSGSIGLGFAIPVDQVRTTADALIAGKTPTHAVLGVSVSDATSSSGSTTGAVVGEVTADGAAKAAGLAAGDVLTSLGGTPVEDATELSAAVRAHQPGDEVAVVYERDGQERTATVTLGTAG